MKISHFSFSRRIIPIKHFQNVSSILEAFPFIRCIHLYGPSQLLINKSNLKRGKKNPNTPNPNPAPKPTGSTNQSQMAFGIMQGERDGEESRLVILVSVEGGDPGEWAQQ